MTIKEFIEKAIEGGWQPFSDTKVRKIFEVEENEIETMIIFYDKVNVRRYSLPLVILDPKAWKAVGKVEGTDGDMVSKYAVPTEIEPEMIPLWQYKMLGLIEALIEDKSIEDYLKTL